MHNARRGLRAGDLIAEKYQLLRKLGVGGMGEVWAARHLGTEREFAVKVLHARVTGSEHAQIQLRREARAAARIGHPGIVDVFDVGQEPNGSMFLVMELLHGRSFHEVLAQRPRPSLHEILMLLAEACDGLQAAHDVGIVHRDLKPANIFVHQPTGAGQARVMLVDFGVSKFIDGGDGLETASEILIGSPRFVSPEQLRDNATIDCRSDIWALGVMLYWIGTGAWPHEGVSTTSLVLSIGTEPPKDVGVVAPYLPLAMQQLIRSCLAPVEARTLRAADVGTVLRRLAAELASLSQGKANAAGTTPLPPTLEWSGLVGAESSSQLITDTDEQLPDIAPDDTQWASIPISFAETSTGGHRSTRRGRGTAMMSGLLAAVALIVVGGVFAFGAYRVFGQPDGDDGYAQAPEASLPAPSGKSVGTPDALGLVGETADPAPVSPGGEASSQAEVPELPAPTVDAERPKVDDPTPRARPNRRPAIVRRPALRPIPRRKAASKAAPARPKSELSEIDKLGSGI